MRSLSFVAVVVLLVVPLVDGPTAEVLAGDGYGPCQKLVWVPLPGSGGGCSCSETPWEDAPVCSGEYFSYAVPGYNVCADCASGESGKQECKTHLQDIGGHFDCKKDWQVGQILMCLIQAPVCVVACAGCESVLSCAACYVCLKSVLGPGTSGCGPCAVCNCIVDTDSCQPIWRSVGELSGESCTGS
jgi:hypothetical protein